MDIGWKMDGDWMENGWRLMENGWRLDGKWMEID